LGVDDMGLDLMDKAILKSIIDKFNGGPVGLKTLSTAVGENPETIEEVFEPYLIQKGLLKRTSQGRKVTSIAYKHFNLLPPDDKEIRKGLF